MIVQKMPFGKYTLFFIVLVALIAFAPALEPTASVALPMVFETAILIFLAILGIERRLWAGCAVFLVSTLAFLWYSTFHGWTLFDSSHALGLGLRYGSAAAFYFLAIIGVLKRLFAEKHVTNDTVIGGIAVYFLIGLFWTIVYHCVLLANAGSFSLPADKLDTFRLAYFSFTCLTTLGFGDITAISRQAQVLCTLEAISGQLYLAVFVARLIGLHTSARK